MAKEWKIKSERRDPDSGMRCKICKGKPTRWYKLMSTTVYRCEDHKTMIASPVYDQGKISSRGELIGMEVNPTFESGVTKVKDYMQKSGNIPNVKLLEEETLGCSQDHSWIERDDPDFEQKVKEFSDKHLRKKHPILFSTMTYYDKKGEHNLLIENPEEYFLCKISKEQVSDNFPKAIPTELVGTEFSAKDLVKENRWT